MSHDHSLQFIDAQKAKAGKNRQSWFNKTSAIHKNFYICSKIILVVLTPPPNKKITSSGCSYAYKQNKSTPTTWMGVSQRGLNPQPVTHQEDTLPILSLAASTSSLSLERIPHVLGPAILRLWHSINSAESHSRLKQPQSSKP